ncbi:MAG: hypothetical protein WKF47_06000 [Geodermatophilaceae bacterium]
MNDGSEQAQFIAQRILELRDEGIELNEIAILYRAHYHAVELQLELVASRHSVSDHERRPVFRAGAHQGRGGVHPVRRESAR